MNASLTFCLFSKVEEGKENSRAASDSTEESKEEEEEAQEVTHSLTFHTFHTHPLLHTLHINTSRAQRVENFNRYIIKQQIVKGSRKHPYTLILTTS